MPAFVMMKLVVKIILHSRKQPMIWSYMQIHERLDDFRLVFVLPNLK